MHVICNSLKKKKAPLDRAFD